MLLILMRHGIAHDGEPDESRPLTEKGRHRVHQMARLLDTFHAPPNLLLSSPRLRALQTAEIVNDSLELRLPVHQTPTLDFDAVFEEFAAHLNDTTAGLPDSTIILASGHQPQMGVLATMALDGRPDGMEVRKAAMIGLRIHGPLAPATAHLDFYLTPRLARMLKG